MKKVMNKLALVALALFVTVGVVSCACDGKEGDKDPKTAGKAKLKITLSPVKLEQKIGGAVKHNDFEVEVKLELEEKDNANVEKLDVDKVKITSASFKDKDDKELKDGKSLKDLGINEFKKGENKTFKLKLKLEKTDAEINGAADAAAIAALGVNGKKEVKVSGEGVDDNTASFEVSITL